MTDPRTAFVDLAQKRMNRAIKAIRAVGELGNRKAAIAGNDVKQIVERLTTEVHATGDRLAAGLDIQPDFRLGGGGEE
jgi:hypothetical protein